MAMEYAMEENAPKSKTHNCRRRKKPPPEFDITWDINWDTNGNTSSKPSSILYVLGSTYKISHYCRHYVNQPLQKYIHCNYHYKGSSI